MPNFFSVENQQPRWQIYLQKEAGGFPLKSPDLGHCRGAIYLKRATHGDSPCEAKLKTSHNERNANFF